MSDIEGIRTVLSEHGYTVIENTDYDAMLLELALLKGLERAVRTMAKQDYAVRELLSVIDGPRPVS